MAAKSEIFPNLDYECHVGYPSITVAGADEVGRGCLAGPVVAGALIVPLTIDFERDSWLLKVNDSKCLKPSLREELVPKIKSWAFAAAIGTASVEEIDQLNIFHASHLAMVRAIQGLAIQPLHVLIDGKFIPKCGLQIPATAIVQGDQKSLSIAAASILAKVWRDRFMVDMDRHFPGYGFAQHKGYPTAAHTVALKKKGISDIHRRSFSPVSALV